MEALAPSTAAGLRPRTVALILLAILTLYGVEAHARRRALSTPASLGDQGAYLAYARHLYESNYTVVEDRNRMPIFPSLLSLLYRPDLTESEFLVRAQAFNVNLSTVLLVPLFFIFRRFFSSRVALALVAVSGFGLFMYRAFNAQTEVLFYFVSFVGFVLLLRTLFAPRWWLALLAGATMGVAHLTKASVLPALGIWALVFGAQTLWNARTKGWPAFGRGAAMLAATIAAFLLVVFPYIQTSKRIYGSYFYNVNSTFIMWCDSSTEGWEFLSAHDKAQWRELPVEQLPSFSKYWREHSVRQMMVRLWRGLLDLSTQNLMPIGYYKFALALAVTALGLAFRLSARLRELLAANFFPAIYCLLFFTGYLALYAWYDKIVNDTRFVLSIFLPFLFCGTLLVLKLGNDRIVSFFGRRWPFPQFFPGLLCALAAIDVLYNARYLFR